MLGFFETIERFLRIERFTTKSENMRARAVYMMGLAFLMTQGINLVAMYYSYGMFSFDHLVSLIACTVVIGTIMGLRFTKNFQIFAGVFSTLVIAGIVSSALNQNTGINSALIPFLILGVVMNGFICGWRATLVFGAMALTCIWSLWWVSTAYDFTPIFDVEKFADRNFQRAVQASLGTILITMIVGFFSKNMHDAFGDLEAGIEAAQKSDRAKTDFLATMSHELCTPMNGIIGMNDVLEDTELTEDQRELTAIIRDSGRDLQTIIGNVLLFSQLDAGRVSLDDSPFNFRNAVTEAAADYALAMSEKGLKFQQYVAESVPVNVIGDKTRTVQILKAVLDNAVKFTDHGTIRLEVHGAADERGKTALLLSIADTGIGIAPTDHARIFERFTQEDGSIKRRHGGTGLGLTVARDLAELMGGALTVKSTPGKGSTFTLRLAYDAAKTNTPALQDAAE